MNNFKIFLIGEEYVKQNSAIMDDVENMIIRNNILDAQNIDLQGVVGENLYAKLINGMDDYYACVDSGGTCSLTDYLTDYDITLIDDYIQPYLLYATLYNSSHDLYLKLTNKGVASIDNPNGRDNSKDDLGYFWSMKKNWKNRQASYMNQLVSYLEDNIDDFPDYATIECDSSLNNDPAKNTSIGLYLGTPSSKTISTTPTTTKDTHNLIGCQM
jgi:hypothetical protein